MLRFIIIACLLTVISFNTTANAAHHGEMEVIATKCSADDWECQRRVFEIKNRLQDRAIQDLLKEVQRLRKDLTRTRSLTVRLEKIERLLDNLPDDLIGKGEIEKLLQAATTNWQTALDEVETAMNARINALREELRQVQAKNREQDQRLDRLENLRVRGEVMGYGTVTVNGMSGGLRFGVVVPTGLYDIVLRLGFSGNPHGLVVMPSVASFWPVTDWLDLGASVLGIIDISDLSETRRYDAGIGPAVLFRPIGPMTIEAIPFIGVGSDQPGAPQFGYGGVLSIGVQLPQF